MNSRLMALFAALIAIGQPAMGSATQASTPETRPMNCLLYTSDAADE